MFHVRHWIVGSAGLWPPRVCPACHPAAAELEDRGAETAPLCRSHTLERHNLDVSTAHAYAGHLTQLGARLNTHLRSMTDSDFTSTADDQTAWIETHGWFAGWALPLTLASAEAGTAPAEKPHPCT